MANEPPPGRRYPPLIHTCEATPPCAQCEENDAAARAHRPARNMFAPGAPASERDVARLEAKLDALETLVREIRHALAAGAVGRWT